MNTYTIKVTGNEARIIYGGKEFLSKIGKINDTMEKVIEGCKLRVICDEFEKMGWDEKTRRKKVSEEDNKKYLSDLKKIKEENKFKIVYE